MLTQTVFSWYFFFTYLNVISFFDIKAEFSSPITPVFRVARFFKDPFFTLTLLINLMYP